MGIKIVYNACFGGFSVSRKAATRLLEMGDTEIAKQLENAKDKSGVFHDHFYTDLARHDPRLVQVVEDLGEEACGPFADLKIAELSGNRYFIDEYDGNESVQEPDDINWTVVGEL